MKTLTVIAITLQVLLAINLASAQNQAKIDSLNKILGTDLLDKERVDIYNAIAFEYRIQDSVQTALFTDKAIKLSNEIEYPEGISDAYYNLGWVTSVKRDYNKALEIF